MEMGQDELLLYFDSWLRHLGDPRTPGQSITARILHYLRETLTACALVACLTTVATMDSVLDGRPATERVSLRSMCGGFSCAVAGLILTSNKRLAIKSLHASRSVAQALLADAGADTKWLQGLQGTAWWQPWGPAALHTARCLLEVGAVACCGASLYSVLAAQQAVHRACAVLLPDLRRLLRAVQVSGVTTGGILLSFMVDTVLAENSETVRLPVRQVLGTFAGMVGYTMFVEKTKEALEALRQAVFAAEAVEKADDVKDLFEREGRIASRRVRSIAAYATIVQVFVLLTLSLDESSATGRFIRSHMGSAARLVITPWHVYIVICIHTWLYSLLALQLAVHHVATVLFNQIGRDLKAQHGATHIVRSLGLHDRITSSCRHLNNVFGYKLPLFHTVSLALPMVATAEVILGRADMFALGMVPLLFVFFVSQCLAGQKLENSSERVGWGAYQGPWLEEDLSSRRLRLHAIQRSTRPICFGTPGMAVLNHRSCEKALRVWFQYLQILLNLSFRDHPA